MQDTPLVLPPAGWRHLLFASAFWLFLSGSFGCGESHSSSTDSTKRGAVQVTVYDRSGAPVEGAKVTAEPSGKSDDTDDLGQVLLSNLTPGFYRVRADHRVAGSAAEALRIEAGEIYDLTIYLPESTDDSGESTDDSGKYTDGSEGSSPTDSGRVALDAGVARDAGRDGSQTIDAEPNDPYIDVATQVEAMLLDPQRPWLYALDQVNNSLLFININERAVKKTLFVGSKPADLDLSLDGSELYVANWGSTQISVVDLSTQDIGRNIFVNTSLGTWQGNPYRIAALADGLLVFTEEDQWCDLKLVRASDGVNLAASGSIYEPDLVASPDGKTLYVGESGSTGSGLHRFSVSGTTLMQIDESGDAPGYGSRKVVVTRDARYVFYAGSKFLANNLKSVLGQFSEAIYASNEDGSLVVGQSKIYDGNTFAIKRPLPITTTVSALNPNGKTLYLYDVKTSRIYIEDLSDL